MARPRTGTETLTEVTGGTTPPGPTGNGGGQPAAPPPEGQGRALPALPTAKTSGSTPLEHKNTVIFGPAGVGKSTLASEWADGNGMFLDCAGELGDLEVYKMPITSWPDFRLACASLAANPGAHPCAIIDTSDVLARFCADEMRRKLGITHESDAEWGKGWDVLRGEWAVRLAKLNAVPNFGVVHVTHSEEIRIKTRTMEWDKTTVRGSKQIRNTLLEMADLCLYVGFTEDTEVRVIKTKPTQYLDAKERGRVPRLPSEIEWPLGANGWEIIKTAWEEGA